MPFAFLIWGRYFYDIFNEHPELEYQVKYFAVASVIILMLYWYLQ